jgi:phospholipid/cholesterol/gamma-HCH transport system ATP-binding protein
MPIIEVEDIHMRFGDIEVLTGVSFSVPERKTLCILGGSGGGKSTLLKIMIGALRPTSGRVLLDGEDICHLPSREVDRVRRKFGVMFQSGALLNSMTVAENVALPLEHHTQLDPETIRTIVKIKLGQVGLRTAAERLPGALSGGMQKRAAIARAMALDPKILFYDEPSAGLDPITTTRIDQLVSELRDGLHMTNVVVTHVMESVRRIADHVLMLDHGRVVLDGTLDDLLSSDDPRIRSFLTGDLGSPTDHEASLNEFLDDLLQ